MASNPSTQGTKEESNGWVLETLSSKLSEEQIERLRKKLES